MTKQLVLIYLFFTPINTWGQKTIFEISKTESYSIIKDSVFVLEIPISIVSDEELNLYLCFKNSIIKLNSEGEITTIRRAYGRGPGELHSVLTCSIDSNFLFVYDDEKKELMKFSKDDLDFIDVRITGRDRIKFITSYNDNVYLLNKSAFVNTISALSVYRGKEFIKEDIDIDIPKYSYLGATRNGGGMTISQYSGYLYYSYLPYPYIWIFNPQTGESKKINIQSDSYKGIDESDVQRLGNDHVGHISYSFSISRVMGLYFVEPNFIVQMTEHGNPWDEQPVSVTLDIYEESQGKVDSFESDSRVVMTNGNKLYLNPDWDRVLTEYDNASSGQRIELFEVLTLIME